LVRIAAKGLCVRYGARRAVDGVDLDAAEGEILALIGPNGSGKSSILKAIAGLVAFEGDIAFDGASRAHRYRGRRDPIGYMPQDTSTQAVLTVLEVVLLGRIGSLSLRVDPADVAKAVAILGELEIVDLAERYIGELSGGQRQLVFLAQVLAGDPSILLLDEPISALDINHQLHVLDTVRRFTRNRGLTCILVLHDLNAAARFADRIAVLRGGRLIGHGAPHDVLDEQLIEQAFHVEAAIETGRDGRPTITPLRVSRSWVSM
jgi:iron complex transport system ATP-binding protein